VPSAVEDAIETEASKIEEQPEELIIKDDKDQVIGKFVRSEVAGWWIERYPLLCGLPDLSLSARGILHGCPNHFPALIQSFPTRQTRCPPATFAASELGDVLE
jgi:hypothetical protein